MVDAVHGADCPGPALGRDTGTDLLPEHVAVRLGNEKRPVHEGLDLRCHTGEVRGRPDDDGIGFCHLRDALVHHVVVQDALPVSVLKAFPAGRAGPDIRPADLDQFGCDPFLLDGVQRVPDQPVRVPVPVGTPIECDDVHSRVSFLFRYNIGSLDIRVTGYRDGTGFPEGYRACSV